MRHNQLVETFPVDAYRRPLDPRSRARFSELLNPTQTAARIAASFRNLHDQGWAIRVELTSAEIWQLEECSSARLLQLDVVHFSAGLPVAVLRTVADGVEFRFGVPLWQAGAQKWLLEAVDRQQLLLLLNTTDNDLGIALAGFGNLLLDRVSLISAATLTRELGAQETQDQMLLAGLKLMDRQALAPLPGSEPLALRVAIAGQGKVGLAVMSALTAAETARVAAMGRHEAAPREGLAVGTTRP
jgi:hypothetical protein